VKVLYFAYGTAGAAIFPILFERLGLVAKNLLCFTYEQKENRSLLSALEKARVTFSTDAIFYGQSFKKIIEFKPDFAVSAHYRDRIPQQVLDCCRYGGMNLHPSLLPQYRGTFSSPWAIINGEKKTGITYHFMNNKFDDGNVILQKNIEIEDSDTGYSLFEKLVNLGAHHFIQAFDKVVVDNSKGLPQRGVSSYYSRRVPFDGYISTDWSDDDVERFIRAMTFPGKPPAKLLMSNVEYNVTTIEEYRALVR
tara:strand:- start:11967 stop:12719 length:753 start_codon:yes stop_codon:yes gene_type:complete